MAHSIIGFFSFLPDWLQVFVISILPIVELRGAIPWGTLALHMPYLSTFLLAWLGAFLACGTTALLLSPPGHADDESSLE